LNGDDDDGSVATMSLREVDKKAKEALLVTFVKQFTIEGDAVTGSTEFEDKVLILTKKHFIVCDYDPSKWTFPVDWGEIQMMAKSEFDKEKKEIDGRINKAKRDEDRSTLSLKRGDNRNRLIRMQKEQRYEMFEQKKKKRLFINSYVITRVKYNHVCPVSSTKPFRTSAVTVTIHSSQ
jgi:hypothetical protein